MATTLGNGTVTFGDGTVQSTSMYSRFGGTSFTSSGTFTVPAGVTRLKITLCGGGGRGGAGEYKSTYDACGVASGSYWVFGGRGGAGGRGTKWVTGLTPGTVLTVTVGAASSSGTPTGGTTSVSGSGITTMTATGGGPGATYNNGAATGASGTFSGSLSIYPLPANGTGGASPESTPTNGSAGTVIIEY